jgi:uncharacterized protein YceH (UPF0502 family)
MIQLTPDESRVLGVLVEKAQTTPEQYPLSLNALTNGSNQKSNRDPVLALTEDHVLDAAEGLRAKGLAVRVDTVGSRVHKYRHNAIEVLHVRTAELAILAELLLRGPQTLGELRGRASRMHPLESLEVTKGMLDALMTRTEPLVRELPPSPGSRAERYVQLLCPDLHPLDATPVGVAVSPTGATPAQTRVSDDPSLADRVTKLEAEVTSLRVSLQKLASSLGETIG